MLSSRRKRITSPEWMEKNRPCAPLGEKELTPITVPQSSNRGPPLLPGLIGALCCTVRALMIWVSLSAVLEAE